ncbi:hypothetical protein [Lactiplantibacillus daowaiensis]|uniref:Prophage protein n=1 Tax=Lactiplantibacillus daowaiensis TaxID=2559918 RepID=A0ABW1S2R2_9LACO
MEVTFIVKRLKAIVRYNNQKALELEFRNKTTLLSDQQPKQLEHPEEILFLVISFIYEDWVQDHEDLGGFFSFDYGFVGNHEVTIDTYKQQKNQDMTIAYNVVVNKTSNSGFPESEFVTAEASFASGQNARTLFENAPDDGYIKFKGYDFHE